MGVEECEDIVKENEQHRSDPIECSVEVPKVRSFSGFS